MRPLWHTKRHFHPQSLVYLLLSVIDSQLTIRSIKIVVSLLEGKQDKTALVKEVALRSQPDPNGASYRWGVRVWLHKTSRYEGREFPRMCCNQSNVTDHGTCVGTQDGMKIAPLYSIISEICYPNKIKLI